MAGYYLEVEKTAETIRMTGYIPEKEVKSIAKVISPLLAELKMSFKPECLIELSEERKALAKEDKQVIEVRFTEILNHENQKSMKIKRNIIAKYYTSLCNEHITHKTKIIWAATQL